MASNAAKEAARQRVAEHAEEVVTGAVFQELAPQSRPAADPRRAAKRKRPATRDPEEEAVQVWRDETRRRLEEPMDYSKIQTRAGPGGHKLHYMPSDAVISLANAYFGFDGWSCEVKASEIDAMEKIGRGFNVACSARMRVTLRDGTFHEDVGTGASTNMPDKAAAISKARKAAVSDARKRCLRLFHDNLGNCLRDQAFIRNLSRAKQDEAKRRAAGAPPRAHGPAAVVSHTRFNASDLMGAEPDPDEEAAALAALEEEEALLALAAVEGTAEGEPGASPSDDAVLEAMRMAAEEVGGEPDAELEGAMLAEGAVLPFSQEPVQRHSTGSQGSGGHPGESRADRNRRMALERQKRHRAGSQV